MFADANLFKDAFLKAQAENEALIKADQASEPAAAEEKGKGKEEA